MAKWIKCYWVRSRMSMIFSCASVDCFVKRLGGILPELNAWCPRGRDSYSPPNLGLEEHAITINSLAGLGWWSTKCFESSISLSRFAVTKDPRTRRLLSGLEAFPGFFWLWYEVQYNRNSTYKVQHYCIRQTLWYSRSRRLQFIQIANICGMRLKLVESDEASL